MIAVPKTLTDDEREAIYRVINTRYPRSVRNMAIIRCLDVTGMRVTELCNLDVQDYEVVDRNLARLHFHVPEKNGSKTGRREVYVAEASVPGSMLLMQAMDAWLKIRREWSPETEALFCTQASPAYSPRLKRKVQGVGNRITRRQVHQSIATYAERAGVEKAYPHAYRHTRVEKLLLNGWAVNEVAGYMGHTVGTLMEEYAVACRASDVKKKAFEVPDDKAQLRVLLESILATLD